VLIIEWLHPSERHTGAELAKCINESYDTEAVLVSCSSVDDVIHALETALDRLLKQGQFPFIHFESHGEVPGAGGASRGMVGPNGELITWKSLAGRLGRMNELVGFRLVVVGAACYGLATLDMFDVNAPAPFAMAIGFNSSVRTGRLYDSMREFYAQMFRGGHFNVHVAVENANRELIRSDGEVLVATTFYLFAKQLVSEFLEAELEPVRFETEAERLNVRATIQGSSTGGLDRFRGTYRIKLVKHCQQAVRTWFAMDVRPDTAIRFPIPVAEIASAVERRYRRRHRS
jgi:hypothetical protein